MKKTLFFLLLILVGPACYASAQPTRTPNYFTRAYAPFDPANVGQINEVAVYAVAQHLSPVGRVKYAFTVNQILATYPDDGFLVGWEAGASQPVVEYALGIVSAKNTVFNSAGTWVLGPTAHEWDRGTGYEFISGLKRWDVGSGDVRNCFELQLFSCDAPERPSVSMNFGLVVDPSGVFVFTYSTMFYEKHDLSTGDSTEKFINTLDSEYYWHIGQLVPLKEGRGPILIYRDGRVTIEGNWWGQVLAPGNQGESKDVIAATIDPSEHWLAFVQDDMLSVFELGLNAGLRWETPISNTTQLIFDQTGGLLFAEGDNSITVWSLEQKAPLATFDTPKVTAMDISEDNRLFLWGDEQGVVHLWAIQATPQAP